MIKDIVVGKSNSLVFVNKSKYLDEFFDLKKWPDIVMLSSWDCNASDYSDVKPLIEKLLDTGCKNFVCAGVHSESLHDFIDNVILDKSIDNELNDFVDIMTTWHDTDTAEEISEFFLYSTNLSNSFLVAILEDGRPEDDELKKKLLELTNLNSK